MPRPFKMRVDPWIKTEAQALAHSYRWRPSEVYLTIAQMVERDKVPREQAVQALRDIAQGAIRGRSFNDMVKLAQNAALGRVPGACNNQGTGKP
jgi:hypothetical protein